MLRRSVWACLVAFWAVSCSWEQDSSPQAYVTLEELDQSAQPMTEADGVLVAVAASGGSVVRFDIESGAIDGSGASICVPIPGSATFVITVFPTATEAVVTATLGNATSGGADAAGDAGSDAAPPGPADANADSTVAIDSGIDGASPPISDAAKDATPTGAAAPPASAVSFLGVPTPCNGLGFQSLGKSSTLVVSLGRAPGPPGAEDSAVDGPTVTGPDATTDASPLDANTGDGATESDTGPTEAGNDALASTDSADKDSQ
jgi:hypothetical protein